MSEQATYDMNERIVFDQVLAQLDLDDPHATESIESGIIINAGPEPDGINSIRHSRTMLTK